MNTIQDVSVFGLEPLSEPSARQVNGGLTLLETLTVALVVYLVDNWDDVERGFNDALDD